MRINIIRIPCADLTAAAEFYEKSIGLTKSFGSPAQGWIGFELDNAQLLLEQQETGEFECGRYLGFSVEVEDIDTFYRECCERGVKFTGPPLKQEWGGIMTHIEDCSANTFSVTESTADGSAFD